MMRFPWIVAVALFAASLAADETYVFRRDGNMRMRSMDSLERESAVRTLIETKEDFFWIRYEGREYIVRDARTLAEIDAAFEPLRAMAGEKQDAKQRVRPLRHRVKAIDRELRHEDDPSTRARLERERESARREIEVAEAELQRVGEKKQRLSREADIRMMQIFERARRNGTAVAR